MALIPCPVGFFEEVFAVVQMKNSQIDTENDKNPKVFYFSNFLRIFVKFLKDFVNWIVLKCHQGNGWLSSSLFRRVFGIFLQEMSQIDI